ncbi:TPA: hypothetical protein ACGO3D_001246, partial [Streptococcus suis]
TKRKSRKIGILPIIQENSYFFIRVRVSGDFFSGLGDQAVSLTHNPLTHNPQMISIFPNTLKNSNFARRIY